MLWVCCILASSVPVSAENAVGPQSNKRQRVLTIADGIRIVLSDNRLLKISLIDKDIAGQDSFIARSALLPRADISLSERFLANQPAARFTSGSVATEQKQSLSYGINVYQTLFDFGKSLALLRSSEKLIEVSKARIEAVKKVAVLEFIVAYYDLLESDSMIEVAAQEAESLASYLGDVEKLYEQGVVVENDVLPARVKLADAKQKLIAARNNKDVAQARLKNILALSSDESILAQDVELEIPQSVDIGQVREVAQKLRIELIVLDKEREASKLRSEALGVNQLPRVYAEGGYRYTENKYQEHPDNAYLEVGAKADLYDGGLTKAQGHKEQLIQQQLQLQRDKLIEDIEFEIAQSHSAFVNAAEQVQVSGTAVEEAKENVRVNRLKYSEGAATSTDVLNAITLATTARTNFYAARYELKRNYARLLYSTGMDLTRFYVQHPQGMNEKPHG
jgi:outer membrane protein